MTALRQATGANDQAGVSRTPPKTRKSVLPLTGATAFGLVLAGHLVHGSIPAVHDPAPKVAAFYGAHGSNSAVGSFLLTCAAFFFLAFASVLRNALRRSADEDGGASMFGFGGAILFAGGIALTAGIGVALKDAKHLDPIAVQALHALFVDLFAPLSLGIAAFLVGNGIAIIRTAALPKWLGWLALPIGLIGLAPEPLGDLGFVGLGIWMLIAGVLLVAPGDRSAATR